MSNPLEEYFHSNSGRLIHKWMHYFEVYDRHLAKFRQETITVVEFGVYHGGSLQMWKEYFGSRARIVGVDIDPRCLSLSEAQIEIIQGDQDDRDFLRRLGKQIGNIDVLIDDGGHKMTQQIATFEELWPNITTGGIYLAEDLHTSYWDNYGGGYGHPRSFVEYAKRLVDHMHAWHAPAELGVSAYTRSVQAMHFYDSVLVLDKADVSQPRHERSWQPSFDE